MRSIISQLYTRITPESTSFHSILPLGFFPFDLHSLVPHHFIRLTPTFTWFHSSLFTFISLGLNLIPLKFIHFQWTLDLHSPRPHYIVYPFSLYIKVTFTFIWFHSSPFTLISLRLHLIPFKSIHFQWTLDLHSPRPHYTQVHPLSLNIRVTPHSPDSIHLGHFISFQLWLSFSFH
jgi:hypothetical protein